MNPNELHDNEERVVLFKSTQKEVFEISLLLSSQNIPHWIEAPLEGDYEIHSNPELYEPVKAIITVYEKENREN